jgi:hypothetical protein
MTVITQNRFDYGDELVMKLKQGFQLELSNLRTGNGDLDSILDRISKKQKQYDRVVQDSKVQISPQKLAEMDKFLMNDFYPIVDKFRSPQMDLFSSEEWTTPQYNKAA